MGTGFLTNVRFSFISGIKAAKMQGFSIGLLPYKGQNLVSTGDNGPQLLKKIHPLKIREYRAISFCLS